MHRALTASLPSAYLLVAVTAACGPSNETGQRQFTATRQEAVLAATADTTTTSVFLLDLRYSNGNAGICSATLVSPRVLLTAGHCIDPSLQGASSVTVKATNKADDTNLHTNDFVDVTKQSRHPQYAGEGAHDLAVLLLATVPSGVTPKGVVRTPPSAWSGQTVRLVGYGRTAVDAASSSGTRRSATVTLSSASDDTLDFGVAGSTGICSGDSGGPAFYSSSGVELVAGVHSFGTSSQCGVGSDVRVDTNLSFIDDFVSLNDPPLCTADGRCVPGCTPADVDCPKCDLSDGVCDSTCPNDPDCKAPACAVANSMCAQDCPTDPDCLGDGDVCRVATDCTTRLCLADARGFSFCSRACTTDKDCQREMVCVASQCRVPAASNGTSGGNDAVRGGCDSSGQTCPLTAWCIAALAAPVLRKRSARAG